LQASDLLDRTNRLASPQNRLLRILDRLCLPDVALD
jgi:hypothetical protein